VSNRAGTILARASTPSGRACAESDISESPEGPHLVNLILWKTGTLRNGMSVLSASGKTSVATETLAATRLSNSEISELMPQ
jgi:hypothetical protein